MRKLKFNLLSFIIFILPFNVYADICSKDVTNKTYNEIQNIKYDITHIGNNNFNIEFINIPNNVTIYDEVGTIYETNNNGIFNYKGGYTYKFYFIINDLDCELNMNLNRNIKFNKFNTYSEREECQKTENKDFKLCNPDYQGNITDEIFSNELKKYNEAKENENIEQLDDNEAENNFLLNRYLIGIICGAVILLIIILIIIRKRRESK